MKLFAISDLHVGYKENRAALERLPDRPDDWLDQLDTDIRKPG